MDTQRIAIAKECLDGAETDRMTFPQSVARLTGAGFDGYLVDLRRASRTYYLPDGDALDFQTHRTTVAIPAIFDTGKIKSAIHEAQTLAPGYTYRDFCAKVAAAGCAGYMVSFPGRRVVYFGRTGEIHVEHFPNPQN